MSTKPSQTPVMPIAGGDYIDKGDGPRRISKPTQAPVDAEAVPATPAAPKPGAKPAAKPTAA